MKTLEKQSKKVGPEALDYSARNNEPPPAASAKEPTLWTFVTCPKCGQVLEGWHTLPFFCPSCGCQTTHHDPKAEYQMWDSSYFEPSGFNPRKSFDEAELQELAQSIRDYGLLEPIIARDIQTDGLKGVRLQIICGERRWRAARLAGLKLIACRLLRGIDDRQALEMALVENLCRKDIDPIEEAQGYARLMELGHKQTDIAQRVNRSQEAVSNAVRLLRLPPAVQGMVSDGRLTASHGRALVSYAEYPAAVEAMAEKAVKDKLSTHDIEAFGWSVGDTLEKTKTAALFAYHGSDTAILEACVGLKCEHLRKSGQGYSYCFSPDCLAKHRQAEKENAQAELAKKVAAARDGEAPKVLTEKELGHTYRVLGEHPPVGCPDECDKRAMAKIYAEPSLVCTDPDCFSRLQNAEIKAENAARAAEMDGLRARIEVAFERGLLDDLMAYVCYSALQYQVSQKMLAEAAEQLGAKLDTANIRNPKAAERCLGQLRSMGSEQASMLLARATIGSDLYNVYGKHPAALWLAERADYEQAQCPVPVVPESTEVHQSAPDAAAPQSDPEASNAPVDDSEPEKESAPASFCATCVADKPNGCRLPDDGKCPDYKEVTT